MKISELRLYKRLDYIKAKIETALVLSAIANCSRLSAGKFNEGGHENDKIKKHKACSVA